jgi:calcineurin-like phosphoesterase family protein
MNNVWFIGDTHFNHTNIIEYDNRPFKTVKEMNESIIFNWNKNIKKTDKVFILGDIAFYDANIIIPRLRGNKILVMGNHDRRKSTKWWLNTGINEVIKYPIVYNGWILSHEPIIYKTECEFKNVHAHLHTNGVCDDMRYCVYYNPVNIEEIKYHFRSYKK